MNERKEFKINNYITLKMENTNINLYVKNELFPYHNYVLYLAIPEEGINFLKQTNQFDHTVEKICPSPKRYCCSANYSCESVFEKYGSILQIWVRNKYNMQLIPWPLALPLLKKLAEIGDITAKNALLKGITTYYMNNESNVMKFVLDFGYLSIFTKGELALFFEKINYSKIKGFRVDIGLSILQKLAILGDPLAKKHFKEELKHRLEGGNIDTLKILLMHGFLDYVSEEKFEEYLKSLKNPLAKLTLWINRRKSHDPVEIVYEDRWFYDLNLLKKNFTLAIWGFQNDAPDEFFYSFSSLIENKYFINLAKLAVKNKVSTRFYYVLNGIKRNTEHVQIVKLAVENNVSPDFYEYFYDLKENSELAKLAALHDPPGSFYANLKEIKKNVDYAKWALMNETSWDFYEYILKIHKDPNFINSLDLSNEKKKDFLRCFSKENE